jgi:hypothetical protein
MEFILARALHQVDPGIVNKERLAHFLRCRQATLYIKLNNFTILSGSFLHDKRSIWELPTRLDHYSMFHTHTPL